MKTIKNLSNNMEKTNQYKFLYDVLGSSITIEVVEVKNDNGSIDKQKGNILINPKKEQYLKFTFFSNHNDNKKERSNNKEDIITFYFKSIIQKEKTKIYIDTKQELLDNILTKDTQDKNNKNNDSNEKNNSEENSSSLHQIIDKDDRDYILYNLFYENDKIYIKNKELISDKDNENKDIEIKMENIDIEQVSNDLRGYSTLRANNANSF